MSVKEDNFIFKRSHRRLTFTSIAAMLPLLLTAVAALLAWITNLSLPDEALTWLLSLPSWFLAVLWLGLPLVALVLSRRGNKHGTLHSLRSWNQLTYRLTLLLLAAELLIILKEFIF